MINEGHYTRPMIREFHAVYEKCIGIKGDSAAGYELAERVWKNRHGKRKYRNYDSFRSSRRHYVAKIRTSRGT